MSDLIKSPTARLQPETVQSRVGEPLSTVIIVALAVVTLYVGRDIFVPIAIAILVSFVLSPPILLVRRAGFGRVISVLVVVTSALVIAFAASAVLTRQVSAFVADLPQYQATINFKLDELRNAAAENALFAKVSTVLENLGKLNPRQTDYSKVLVPSRQHGKDRETERPVPVEIYQPSIDPLVLLQTIAGTALSPLETISIALIFVIFILLQREDLRDRFIRLVGSGDLHRTTSAMNDAVGRLSRFLLAQTLVNLSFGFTVAVGLSVIGIPSPILWGTTAFLLRFIPYIGAFIAAVFPVALAAAVDPGWGIALETLALFLIVEMVIGQAVEPWLYGHNTGISPIAVVISATFWTWLWGLVGLVLSTPLTVCLVVLGRHVDRLAFLDIIFGDAPPLTPVESFYQRLLVGNASEIADQAEQFLKTDSLVKYCDDVALEALLMAHVDLRRGVLDEARQIRIKETVEEVLDDLSDHVDPAQTPVTAKGTEVAAIKLDGSPSPRLAFATKIETENSRSPEIGSKSQTSVLCVSGRSFLDEAAATIFARILESHGIASTVEPAEVLTISRIQHLAAKGAQIICLSYLEADAANVRFAVRRLRRRLPECKILVCFWKTDTGHARELCPVTMADFCATTLKDALDICLGKTVEKPQGETDPS